MNTANRRKALQQMSYGLYVLGASTPDAQQLSILANWVVQVSFSPPMIAVAIEQDSAMHAAIAQGGRFTVNILPADGGEMARSFLRSPAASSGEFAGWKYELTEKGSPFLVDSMSWLECEVRQSSESGDHTLFVAEVVGADVRRDGPGLAMKDSGLNYWKESS